MSLLTTEFDAFTRIESDLSGRPAELLTVFENRRLKEFRITQVHVCAWYQHHSAFWPAEWLNIYSIISISQAIIFNAKPTLSFHAPDGENRLAANFIGSTEKHQTMLGALSDAPTAKRIRRSSALPDYTSAENL